MPQGLCVVYVTLIWATREIEILLMFAGQMGCEALNFALKRWIKEERPKRKLVNTLTVLPADVISEMFGKGYGMPSSHAQFVAFFSISLTLWLLLRHVPGPTMSYSPSTILERSLLSILALMGAAAVASSRVYLSYHTPRQVWVGVGVGVASAVLYFIFTTILRRSGLIEWALDTTLARKFRMRDLITTEDIQDAGWGRFESRRQKSVKGIDTRSKKSR